MLNYQFDFYITEGEMNTFLVGSKGLFEKVKIYETLLSNAIDVNVQITYKLIELEHHKISYNINAYIEYPIQMLLGEPLLKRQIDRWFINGWKLLFSDNLIEDVPKSLDMLAEELELTNNFIYVKISEKKVIKALEDLKKMSILLFNKLDFYEKKDEA